MPKGFQTLAPPEIIPPDIPPPAIGPVVREMDFSGEGVEGGRGDGDETIDATDIAAAPVMVPMTVRPQLKNTAEVQRALQRYYPSILRDAGVGGTPVLWFLVNEEGKVLKTQLFKTSGYEQLDEAAFKVADIMEFSPAMNRDKRVTVWVQIPITFKVE